MTATPSIGEAAGGVPEVLRRGVGLSDAFLRGIGWTLGLGVVAVAGRMVPPVAIQRALDEGITAPGGPDPDRVLLLAAVAGTATLCSAVAAYRVSVRLYHSSEAGLAESRVRAFRHIHDLSVLHQRAEQRGSLVARVTADIDSVSAFLQYKGLMLALSALQMVAVTVVMGWYSLPLTLLIWACYLPMMVFLHRRQPAMTRRFGILQTSVGRLLGATAESLVGVEAVHAHAAQDYVTARVDRAVEETRVAQVRSQRVTTVAQTVAELAPNLVTVALVLVGVRLVAAGQLSVGDLTAVLFLAVLFVAPTRNGVAAFAEAQRAVAGWRRLLGVLDLPIDVTDPSTDAVELPARPACVRFDRVSFGYPEREPVLHDLSLTVAAGSRIAVVGATGSGKTTFAKLASRLMDPDAGQVLLDGTPARRIRLASLRRAVLMVPQEGFLFDTTIAENVRFGAPDIDDAGIRRTFAELGLSEWLAALPDGVHTQVGQRGESLSAGERQLVALARAHAADPGVLILDEATSAVDPVTETRIQRAMDGLTDGRTAIVIAHRLATAETADEVLVFADGRIVERGRHRDLVARRGTYAALHDAWASRRARREAD